MSSLAGITDMNGNPLVFEQDFDHALGDPDIHLLFGQLIRNAVVMAVHIDVIIDIDPRFLPSRIRVGGGGQRF